ncbi:MAG: SBBP repeat-containing protein [Bacteroidota bacterium]|nr:SBBP repeat-containing protein [Bacteroidota bacterium]
MKKKTFLLLSFLWIATNLLAQPQLEWAANFGGPDWDFGKSVALDSDNNVYTTGRFGGTVDFDPNAGHFYLISNGNDDIFVSKLDSSGNFIWAKSVGASNWNDGGYSVTIDTAGNVLVAGWFGGTVDFDPGPGICNLTSFGGNDIFVFKLTTDGNFIWAKNMGGNNNDHARSIAVDNSGNVYTTGKFEGIGDFNPDSLTTNSLTSNGGFDIFISKLNASGDFVWAKSIGGSSYDYGVSISLDTSGNIYTTGYFKDNVDFNPDSVVECNLASNGMKNVFISKLDASGNFVWAKNWGGIDDDWGYSLKIDFAGNVISTGWYGGTVDFDPGTGVFNLTSSGNMDIYVSKLDASGNFIWAKSMGGNNNDHSYALALDAAGNIYTTGSFEGTADFDPGIGTSTYTSNGLHDIFISKLDASGNFIWATSMGGINFDYGYSITIDESENIYTAGYFYGTTAFDPAACTSVTSAGGFDVFILKHNQVYSIEGQEIILPAGWSLFSTYLHLSDSNIVNVLSSISSNVVIAKSGTGDAYWPMFGINYIGDMVIGQGYQINLTNADTLYLQGNNAEPENTLINIPEGWSLLGYLRITPGSIIQMLSSISSEITIVKSGNGLVYWPSFGLNAIGNMLPGQAYKIKVTSAQGFYYPANTANYAKSVSQVILPTYYRNIKNTGSSMTLGIPLSSWETIPNIGDEIAAFAENGLLLGAAVFNNQNLAITIWGNDELSDEQDGIYPGNSFFLKKMNNQNKEESELIVQSWQEGDSKYEINKISVAGKINLSSHWEINHQSFILHQNTPNPFSNETEFSFYLPKECVVEFEIFNLVGERVCADVARKVSAPGEKMPKGKHTIKFSNKNLPAGTYFYRLKTEGFEQTKKMVIM